MLNIDNRLNMGVSVLSDFIHQQGEIRRRIDLFTERQFENGVSTKIVLLKIHQ